MFTSVKACLKDKKNQQFSKQKKLYVSIFYNSEIISKSKHKIYKMGIQTWDRFLPQYFSVPEAEEVMGGSF